MRNARSDAVKVKDILRPNVPIKTIMVRTNDPVDPQNKDGILAGYCSWDGNKLISLDGDIYDLEDEIYRYEYEADGSVTYWYDSEWVAL